jgi:hypothetical protein
MADVRQVVDSEDMSKLELELIEKGGAREEA